MFDGIPFGGTAGLCSFACKTGTKQETQVRSCKLRADAKTTTNLESNVDEARGHFILCQGCTRKRSFVRGWGP